MQPPLASPLESQGLDLFYNSRTFQLISEGLADMHCLSDLCLAEEVECEVQNDKNYKA